MKNTRLRDDHGGTKACGTKILAVRTSLVICLIGEHGLTTKVFTGGQHAQFEGADVKFAWSRQVLQ